MMNCEQYKSLISALIDDEIAADDRVTLDVHLSGCANCRATEEGMRRQSADLRRQWMVSGWRYRPIGMAFYRKHPECIADLRRIVDDPAKALGKSAMTALAAIRDRIPLDMFGIDFDVDSEGRVVLFEAGASIAFLELQEAAPDLALSPEPYRRINDAFRRMVLSRILSPKH